MRLRKGLKKCVSKRERERGMNKAGRMRAKKRVVEGGKRVVEGGKRL